MGRGVGNGQLVGICSRCEGGKLCRAEYSKENQRDLYGEAVSEGGSRYDHMESNEVEIARTVMFLTIGTQRLKNEQRWIRRGSPTGRSRRRRAVGWRRE